MPAPIYNSSDYFDLNGNELVVGGLITVKQGGYITEPTQDNVVANPGGGSTNAVQLNAVINRLATVATAGDSVKLPASLTGWTMRVINSASNAATIYPLGTDTINNTSSYTLAANTTKSFSCLTTGAWWTN